jgi:hypothetical protein
MRDQAVAARIAELSRLSGEGRSWPIVDMSAAGVAARLEVLAATSNLCLALVEIGAHARPPRPRSEG